MYEVVARSTVFATMSAMCGLQQQQKYMHLVLCALILSETLALYKSFTYLLTW